jgi:hypothetical protein
MDVTTSPSQGCGVAGEHPHLPYGWQITQGLERLLTNFTIKGGSLVSTNGQDANFTFFKPFGGQNLMGARGRTVALHASTFLQSRQWKQLPK